MSIQIDILLEAIFQENLKFHKSEATFDVGETCDQ